jgi:hypothetical protein
MFRAAEIGHVALVPVKFRSCHEPVQLIKIVRGSAEEVQGAKSKCKPQQRLCMSADLLTESFLSPAREAASVLLVTWTRSSLFGLCPDHLNTSDTRRKWTSLTLKAVRALCHFRRPVPGRPAE